MAHIVLKYVGDGHYLTPWPASDLTDADVAERAAERGLTADEYVREALALKAGGGPFYQLYREGKAEFADVAEAAQAEAKKAEATAKPEPRRRGG